MVDRKADGIKQHVKAFVSAADVRSRPRLMKDIVLDEKEVGRKSCSVPRRQVEIGHVLS